jgi:hypothetical protein
MISAPRSRINLETMGSATSHNRCPTADDLNVNYESRTFTPTVFCDKINRQDRARVSYANAPYNYTTFWDSIKLTRRVVDVYPGMRFENRSNDNIRCRSCDDHTCTYYFDKKIRLANMHLALYSRDNVPRDCTESDKDFVAQFPPPPSIICPSCRVGK